MTHQRTADGMEPTRRQTLRATLTGAVTVTAGSGVVAAADGCDVTEEERAEVRQAYADEASVTEALEAQEDVRAALVDGGYVEGTTEAVQVLAPLVDCEPTPEHRIYRQTEDGYLTVSLWPLEDHGYATINPFGDSDGCEEVKNGCQPACFTGSCCHCRSQSCPGSPDANHCCMVCNMFCAGGCRMEYNVVEPDPLEIDVSEGWFEEIVFGE